VTNEEKLASVGIFNVADSYYAAAASLEALKLPTSHASFPVQFLYHQSMELYLKALLRQLGYSEDDAWGHVLKKLADKAKESNVAFDQFDCETFEMMDAHNLWETSKYLRVGLRVNFPDIGRLQKTCADVREIAQRCLKAAGHSLRPTPISYALNKG